MWTVLPFSRLVIQDLVLPSTRSRHPVFLQCANQQLNVYTLYLQLLVLPGTQTHRSQYSLPPVNVPVTRQMLQECLLTWMNLCLHLQNQHCTCLPSNSVRSGKLSVGEPKDEGGTKWTVVVLQDYVGSPKCISCTIRVNSTVCKRRGVRWGSNSQVHSAAAIWMEIQPSS